VGIVPTISQETKIMPLDVFLRVHYEDAGPFTVEKSYLLNTQLADDGSNMDAVMTNGDDLTTALDVLTWDKITFTDYIVVFPRAGAAPNVAANNSVETFHRMTDNVTGKKAHFIVAAWDDLTFDKNPNGSMSAAYNTAAGAVAPLTRNPETGNAWTYVDAQNRATKRGQRQFKP
jgi:hypothetical protein